MRSYTIKYTCKVSPKGIETTSHTSFPESRWAKRMKKYYKMIKARVVLEYEERLDMEHILHIVKPYVKVTKKRNKSKAAVSESDSGDSSILGDGVSRQGSNPNPAHGVPNPRPQLVNLTCDHPTSTSTQVLPPQANQANLL